METDDTRGEVTEATRQAEAEEASSPHQADRPATQEEEGALTKDAPSESTREHYKEMAERGANEQGEGRIP